MLDRTGQRRSSSLFQRQSSPFEAKGLTSIALIAAPSSAGGLKRNPRLPVNLTTCLRHEPAATFSELGSIWLYIERASVPAGATTRNRRRVSELIMSLAVCVACVTPLQEMMMNGLIYLVGLVVVIMFILSFLGLR
jgi:hypothetical protein